MGAICIDDNGDLSFEYPESGKTTSNIDITGPGNYYFPVFPGVELAEGFRVNCYVTGDEGEDTLTPFYYNGTFTTARGQIIILSEIESRLGQYYVTPEGAGAKAGQNWANAMDVESFKAFVTNQDNHHLLIDLLVALLLVILYMATYKQIDYKSNHYIHRNYTSIVHYRCHESRNDKCCTSRDKPATDNRNHTCHTIYGTLTSPGTVGK